MTLYCFNVIFSLFQFLKLQPSYEKKMQLCCDMVEFLCKETPSEINSQRLLEVTLYKVQLTVLTGRIKSAKNIFRVSYFQCTFLVMCEISHSFRRGNSSVGYIYTKQQIAFIW